MHPRGPTTDGRACHFSHHGRGGVVSLDEMDNAISNEQALDCIENEYPDEVNLSLHNTETREEIEEDLLAHHYRMVLVSTESKTTAWFS